MADNINDKPANPELDALRERAERAEAKLQQFQVREALLREGRNLGFIDPEVLYDAAREDVRFSEDSRSLVLTDGKTPADGHLKSVAESRAEFLVTNPRYQEWLRETNQPIPAAAEDPDEKAARDLWGNPNPSIGSRNQNRLAQANIKEYRRLRDVARKLKLI